MLCVLIIFHILTVFFVACSTSQTFFTESNIYNPTAFVLNGICRDIKVVIPDNEFLIFTEATIIYEDIPKEILTEDMALVINNSVVEHENEYKRIVNNYLSTRVKRSSIFAEAALFFGFFNDMMNEPDNLRNQQAHDAQLLISIFENKLKSISEIKLANLKVLLFDRQLFHIQFLIERLNEENAGYARLKQTQFENDSKTIVLTIEIKEYERMGQLCERHYFGRLINGTYVYQESSDSVDGIAVEKCETTRFENLFCMKKLAVPKEIELKVSDCFSRIFKTKVLFALNDEEWYLNSEKVELPEIKVLSFNAMEATNLSCNNFTRIKA